jgi:hypothetical protein
MGAMMATVCHRNHRWYEYATPANFSRERFSGRGWGREGVGSGATTFTAMPVVVDFADSAPLTAQHNQEFRTLRAVAVPELLCERGLRRGRTLGHQPLTILVRQGARRGPLDRERFHLRAQGVHHASTEETKYRLRPRHLG